MRRWNDDPFTKKAQKENYEARSVYKLKEIDQREKIFKGVKTVIDLGASPGSWTQYCLERMPKEGTKIVAIDISPLGFEDDRVIFLQESIETVDLVPHLGDKKADLVLSDMAPKTSGVHDRDVALSLELATLALEASKRFLKKGGHFVVKLFMGDGFEDYNKELKSLFGEVSLLRPESTRKHSREIYFIAKNFKG
jgi:23S rRNA (uridine2552-2'-O)-methyltransferase